MNKDKKPSLLLSYVRGHKRALQEGLLMPWKNPLKTLMTIVTLSICFYIPLFLWTLWLNYDELKQNWQQQGSIAVFVNNNVDMKEAGILLQEIKEKEQVESAFLLNSTVLKEQLAQDEQLSQFTKLITDHDLPQQINIKIKTQTSVDTIKQMVNEFEINPQIEYVSYDAQWLQQLQALTDALLNMARISGLLFMLIVMVILGNTITNEIANHKGELRLLELMGASWAQVRRKFLYQGTFLGLYSGLLALLFLFLSFWWLEDSITTLAENFGVDVKLHGLSFSHVTIVVLIAVIVTWLAARLSLSTQRLNQVQN